jgi:hypothetical protein
MRISPCHFSRPVALAGLAIMLVLVSCGSDFIAHDYFPLQAGFCWHYTGAISTVTIQEELATPDLQYIALFADSLGDIKWKERYIKTRTNVNWIAMEPQAPLPASLRFEKGIPIGPCSAKIGDQQVFQTIERSSTNVTRTIKIRYTMVGSETITVPAGTFAKALKMVMNVQYPDDSSGSLASENVYWFVQNVGVVKFSWDGVTGELKSATLGNRVLP